jgi:RNA polymerase sigma-70 factor (ECF subfamily)
VTGSDAELVARILADDDRRAFATLIARHQGAVLALLRRLTAGDMARAEDLAQEVFVRVYTKLATYAGGAFGGWVYRIAVHAFLDTVRRGARPPVPLDDDVPDVAPSPLLRHDLEEALADLSADERTAIVVTLGRDRTHEEAAALLGWPLGTLKTLQARARRKLARRLADWKEDV